MTVFDFIGGERMFAQIVVMLVVFSFISSFINNKLLRFILAFVSGLILIFQCTSLYLVQELISYRFVIHLNSRDILSMLHLYRPEMVLFQVFLFFCFVLIFYFSPIIKKTALNNSFFMNQRKLILVVSGVFCVYVLSSKNGFFPKTYELISFFSKDYNDSTFEDNIKALGITKSKQVSEIDVSSKLNKNIIILSLESFEKGYLSDKMSDLTPNLRKLKNNSNWSFIEISENEGSKWTSGSLYTTLTGFPAFFGGQHNHLFQNFYKSKIPSLFNIFNKLGHNTIYMVNDAKFSGTDNMLYALGVDKIIDNDVLGIKAHDKDLFDEAKNVISKNENKNQKYTLYLSTLSTHSPTGVYDKRMEEFVKPKNSDIEFMASAVDFMIGDLLEFLEQNNYLENTQVFILPDHLKHGSPEMFDGTGERGLYVLTNAPKATSRAKENLYQLDLPTIILDKAGITCNHSFLAEQVEGDKNEFIKRNITNITKVNVSGFLSGVNDEILIPELSENFETYKRDTLRFIAHGGGEIDNNIYTNSLEALNRSYEKGFRLFELDFRKTSDDKFVAIHDWKQWVGFTNCNIETPVSHEYFMNSLLLDKYTPLGMLEINEWFEIHKDAILITDKVNTPVEFSKEFKFKDRLKMELFSWEAVLEAVENDIIPIVSENVVFQYRNSIVQMLNDNKINSVALSRSSLRKNVTLFKELQNAGIKIYAYHINSNIDKDEEYAVKYEMDYYYGIYADNWSFEN